MSGDSSRPTSLDGIETASERFLRIAMALRVLGVSDIQTRLLLSQYDINRIEQQLMWLPFRNSRKKASMIVSAIQQNYDKPANFEA